MNAQLQTIEPAQHDRRKYLGGSDVAAVLGISPWRTPLDVFMDKVGAARDESPDPGRERVLNRGKRMEPYVLDLLAEETGLRITGRGNRYIDREHDFIAAEIDAEAATGENIEIKTVSPFKAREWGDEQTDAIPVHYTAQAMHGLMVTGAEVCVFGVLIGGDDFRVYRVVRDDETIAAIRAREVAFWQHVVTGVAPEPSTASDIARMFDRDAGTCVEADADTFADCQRLRALKASIKASSEEADALEERIKLAMRDAATLTFDGKLLATWKTQTARRFNQRAFTEAHPDLAEQFKTASDSRVFRIR